MVRPFLPEIGETYRGENGRKYRCIGVSRVFGTARLRDVARGRTFTAIEVWCRNGRIGWERTCSVRE